MSDINDFAVPGGIKPDYWDAARDHLIASDRILRDLIPRLGPGHLEGRGDALTTLARSIVGQQISVKAAQAVWDRAVLVLEKHRQDGDGHLWCEPLLRAEAAVLREAGLSLRKIEYTKHLAQRHADGLIDVARWEGMDDEAVIQDLITLRGVGRWTAEMFLIFHLLRPNVLPLDDVGLIKGVSRNWFAGEPVSRSDVRELAGAWTPYSSVATWYIWRSLDPLPVAY
ncbi:DNA-3-methyladenine glycosylase family protein [Amphibiibacter pelophylacis]|uniref:DNA-3-methyladenine glycosylase 2 family protein n=1 Tax=Amphibiibacter pelophylacis TaxID=1799477 RepID=A0ACC6NZA3_9BURK